MPPVVTAAVPPQLGTFLALDFGLKRTGLAVGNRLLKTAQPQGSIHAEGDARFNKIGDTIREWLPDALVARQRVGLANPGVRRRPRLLVTPTIALVATLSASSAFSFRPIAISTAAVVCLSPSFSGTVCGVCVGSLRSWPCSCARTSPRRQAMAPRPPARDSRTSAGGSAGARSLEDQRAHAMPPKLAKRCGGGAASLTRW